jgi:hypothetical protein
MGVTMIDCRLVVTDSDNPYVNLFLTVIKLAAFDCKRGQEDAFDFFLDNDSWFKFYADYCELSDGGRLQLRRAALAERDKIA